MDRTSMIQALKNVAMRVTMEETDDYYKTYKKLYPKIAMVKDIDDVEWIKGSYYQCTTIIGISELYERNESEPIRFEDLTEGYVVYAKKRSFDVGTEFTLELNRDYKQVKEEMIKIIKEKNYPKAVARTTEKFVAKFYNRGGYTSGDDIFDNTVSGILNPSYGSFLYDGKPWIAASGNNHVAKAHSTTYYNHLGALPLTYDNLLTGDTLLLSTNAKMENGEPFDNTHDNFLLTGTALNRTGKKVLESPGNPSNNNNEMNTIQGEYEQVVNPYIDDTDAWFLGNKYGLLIFDSPKTDFDIWEVHETRKARVSAHKDLAGAPVNFRSVVAGNLDQS